MSPPTPRKTIRPSAMPVRKVKMVGVCMSPPRVPEPVGCGKGGTGTCACAISGGAGAAGGVACRCCWAQAGAKQEMNNVAIASASFFMRNDLSRALAAGSS